MSIHFDCDTKRTIGYLNILLEYLQDSKDGTEGNDEEIDKEIDEVCELIESLEKAII